MDQHQGFDQCRKRGGSQRIGKGMIRAKCGKRLEEWKAGEEDRRLEKLAEEFVYYESGKDLEEFRSELKNESSIIHDVPSHAGDDLPVSFETNIVIAQESIGQAIGGIRSSMWKSTAQIISQVRDSILASDHDRDLLLSNTDTNRSSVGKQYNRFNAQVRALQCDFNTYCSKPEDKEDYEK
ncbi:hypothetical protein POTOM_008481 [Populus tomentosa]|uniref:Uncharacterized protein n=1 Tax=Populus tomentosa TaxID=118781 RepID=A0A8X8DC05_POPTO|nr:hypothetical protein POTOM_008481 [Populus tomentosa]